MNAMRRGIMSMLSAKLGHRVFGIASLATGIITLAGPERGSLRYVICAAAVAQSIGGAAILFRWTAKAGAILIGAGYLVSVLISVPPIIATPLVYGPWGNFFEPFSVMVGAAMFYAWLASWWERKTVQRTSRIVMGVCTISFMLYQALYLRPTAGLVPKWIPPSARFWTIATTIFFGLAALALLANVWALLAARLEALMLTLFGLIVWVPLIASSPRNLGNWSECAETFAIAGAVWIFADAESK